jgi:predicted esterase
MRPSWTLVALCLAAARLDLPPAAADEARILSAIRDFFQTQDLDRRAGLARQIEFDPAYDRAQVTGWLHRAVPFEAQQPGQRGLDVPLEPDTTRRVVLRIPRGYDPAQPWPLIYALHGTNGRGEDIIAYLERLLGPDVESYVVAAPTGYQEAALHGSWPPIMEHSRLLAAIRRAVHIDSDRVFAVGYSRGGHTTWTVAFLHADLFAAAMPVAGTFLLPDGDLLWETLLPNVAGTRIFAVWGAHDDKTDEGGPSPEGGIAGLNRKLCALAESLKFPVECFEDPDKGHGNVVPPAKMVQDWLACRRAHYPPQVAQRFRHIGQAQAYWLEGHTWTGPRWAEKRPTVELRPGEKPENPADVRQALLRMYRSLLGELRGTIDGQVLDVRRNKVSELTIWIGDGMIDWSQPVTVKVSGEKVFDGRLTPDLLVCLSQAARTYDFDRLRWAGLRYKSGSKLRPVTGRTEFPPADGRK